MTSHYFTICIDLQGIKEFKKTLPWSQTHNTKGVNIILKKCNIHAFSGLWATLNKLAYVDFSKKHCSLPTKLPTNYEWGV